MIISDALWHRQFNGDASVLGRSATLDGDPYTIVGVMAPDFHFPSESQLGALTKDIAKLYGHPVDVTRRQLIRALDCGRVIASGRGRVGGIAWWPVGLLAEIRAEIRAA